MILAFNRHAEGEDPKFRMSTRWPAVQKFASKAHGPRNIALRSLCYECIWIECRKETMFQVSLSEAASNPRRTAIAEARGITSGRARLVNEARDAQTTKVR
jgi:hypothetical protein